jgi:aerobic-type carbon monoxide dehydrogenase small subunit (CoxS/CutS family)
MDITFYLNGKSASVDVDEDTALLEVLRNDIELNGQSSVADWHNAVRAPCFSMAYRFDLA